MKIDRVILACDDNPLYQNFWQLVATAWTNMGIRPTLALVGDTKIDENFGDVVHIPSIDGISNGFITQVVRAFLPILFPNDVCLLSDIDMMPLNKNYFLKAANPVPDNFLLVYSADAYPTELRYPMCYLAAKGAIFQEILTVKEGNISLIIEGIKDWHSEGLGWNTDEVLLGRHIKAWQGFDNQMVLLNRGWSPLAKRRLDRARWFINPLFLYFNYYIDAHLPRPYDEKKLKRLMKYIESQKF